MPAPEPGQKWGILGGTFDPVHRGHLQLAQEIRAAVQLDGVMLIPAFHPPHRNNQTLASFDDRLAMLRLAADDDASFVVSNIEEKLDRPGYTLETMRAVKKRHPKVEFFFIVGADNLSMLRTWHEWETVLEENRLLVGSRPGADLSRLASYSDYDLEVVETSLIDISSTNIRWRIHNGIDLDELSRLVPSPVAKYIAERKIYL